MIPYKNKKFSAERWRLIMQNPEIRKIIEEVDSEILRNKKEKSISLISLARR